MQSVQLGHTDEDGNHKIHTEVIEQRKQSLQLMHTNEARNYTLLANTYRTKPNYTMLANVLWNMWLSLIVTMPAGSPLTPSLTYEAEMSYGRSLCCTVEYVLYDHDQCGEICALGEGVGDHGEKNGDTTCETVLNEKLAKEKTVLSSVKREMVVAWFSCKDDLFCALKLASYPLTTHGF